MVAEPFIRRMAQSVDLTAEERSVLHDLARDRVRSFDTRDDIVREGEPPRALNLVLSGWVCRYKMLEDGRRQILAFLVPGDLCDLNNYILEEMDHSLTALTPSLVAQIPHGHVDQAIADHPRLARPFWWHSLTVIAMQREWTMNMGQRTAAERLGSLFCELFLRLAAVGLTDGRGCEFPITQIELAEATGLTPVHVNRTLQDMRAAGLIALRNRMLTIPDFERLAAASLFTPDYLHLKRPVAPPLARGRDRDAPETVGG
jgi:CRP-like cAMP-binding protein